MAQTTGDVDVHDVLVDAEHRLVFVNTLFSCLATPCERLSFQPLWQPPFIDHLAAEDRCHLNGLASHQGSRQVRNGLFRRRNQRHGWREQRADGGCVLDVDSGEDDRARLVDAPFAARLSRPALAAQFGTRRFRSRGPCARARSNRSPFVPGYARGLAFIDRYAIIGLSRPRNETFSGLPLDDALARRGVTAGCGLLVLDLERGVPVQWLQIEGRVDELYDVLVLPGVRRPKALGLKTDEIRRNVWFQDDDRIARWTAGERQ